MPEGLKIFVGGIVVLALFAAHIWLLGLLNDKLDSRAEAVEAANLGQASATAERLVVQLGTILIKTIRALAWLTGLLVPPCLVLIVYEGAWLYLPIVTALSLGMLLIVNWSDLTLRALNRET
uniref:hypothetical protein n=1 Tax=Altererythrobacter segetis TaxID=1104773 RepID=UPI00140A5E71|nr:hypothetical protein [Altererythrobacter segetis]